MLCRRAKEVLNKKQRVQVKPREALKLQIAFPSALAEPDAGTGEEMEQSPRNSANYSKQEWHAQRKSIWKSLPLSEWSGTHTNLQFYSAGLSLRHNSEKKYLLNHT